LVKITITAKWCKKCKICVTFCPKAVFEWDALGRPVVKYPERCIKCMLCVGRCPDFACEVEEVPEKEEEKG
jgi:2-oxoglutarate ferredoxin oxidoreductase subunit delta